MEYYIKDHLVSEAFRCFVFRKE